MTKADLIDEVSRAVGMTRKDAEVIVDAIFDNIVRALRGADNPARIPTFKVKPSNGDSPDFIDLVSLDASLDNNVVNEKNLFSAGASSVLAQLMKMRKDPATMPAGPYRTGGPDSRNGTTIGNAVRIVGRIFTKEDLNIDGAVEGAIESEDHKITVGPSGRVQASIRARDILILGDVQGNVEARDTVDLRRDARLVGDITASRVRIEEGALLKGAIDNIETRKPKLKHLAAAPA